MVFSSIIFLFLFLPVTLAVYFFTPNRLKNFILLCLSLLFYAWGENFFLLIMLASIFVNYCSGMMVKRLSPRPISRLVLYFAISFNLGLLIAFKYINFIVDNINQLLPLVNLDPILIPPVHLPIGISFFTFQAISYVVDVYRNDAPAQKNPVNMGLYIALFPQLIAGPIIRYHDIANQLVRRSVRLRDFSVGTERFIFGLGKKVLIANPIGLIVEQIYAIPTSDLTISLAWMGVACLSIQVYFDFSGYSDMAIGLGRMFGFRFKENFNYPYIAQSMQDFWRRWHISLSSWFRDYLYIPLGGNRRGTLRTYLHLVTVFLLFGLWHGASWNFVLFGLYHGTFLVIERVGFINLLNNLPSVIRILYVNFVFVVGWPFFQTKTIPIAISYIAAMFGQAQGGGLEYNVAMYFDSYVTLIFVMGVICSLPILPLIRHLGQTENIKSKSAASVFGGNFFTIAKVVTLLLIFFVSIMNLASGIYNPFIYFRF